MKSQTFHHITETWSLHFDIPNKTLIKKKKNNKK